MKPQPTPMYHQLIQSYVTVGEAAKLMRVIPRTVYTMVEFDRLRHARLDPKRLGLRGRVTQQVVLVLRADVEAHAAVLADKRARHAARICPKGHPRRTRTGCADCKRAYERAKRAQRDPMWHQWTADDTATLTAMLAAGSSRYAIARTIGCHYSTVGKRMRGLGMVG